MIFVDSNKKFLSLREVCSLTGFSKSSIYRMERDGQFPRHRKIGKKKSVWMADEVDQHLCRVMDRNISN